MSTLLLAKTTEWCRIAERFVVTHLPNVTVATGKVGDAMPAEAANWSGDHIVSFVSPWIVPAALLEKARGSALNFHPGPPEYPGIGCYNFALYDGVTEYGVTCHRMLPKVDTGEIVRVSRFPVTERDSVATLIDRSMTAMIGLLFEIVALLAENRDPSASEEGWRRPPFTRHELNELGRISPDMDEIEIRRRHRAMHYPPYPGLFLDLAGIKFRADEAENGVR